MDVQLLASLMGQTLASPFFSRLLSSATSRSPLSCCFALTSWFPSPMEVNKHMADKAIAR